MRVKENQKTVSNEKLQLSLRSYRDREIISQSKLHQVNLEYKLRFQKVLKRSKLF
jgi:hypothetical protein